MDIHTYMYMLIKYIYIYVHIYMYIYIYILPSALTSLIRPYSWCGPPGPWGLGQGVHTVRATAAAVGRPPRDLGGDSEAPAP